MAEIHLVGEMGEGKFAIVDDSDYEALSSYRWRINTHGHLRATKYEGVERKRRDIYMHRLIMNPTNSEVVDHINGDTLDNRRENLRICSQAENARNGNKKPGSSSYKGVYRSGNSWTVELTKDYEKYYVGVFDSEKDAAKAYDAKAVELFGEFARLNFPSDPIENISPRITRCDNKSGFRGVSWNKRRKKWHAQINKDGKRVFSKYFDDKYEAARKYNEWALIVFGESTKLNDIPDKGVSA